MSHGSRCYLEWFCGQHKHTWSEICFVKGNHQKVNRMTCLGFLLGPKFSAALFLNGFLCKSSHIIRKTEFWFLLRENFLWIQLPVHFILFFQINMACTCANFNGVIFDTSHRKKQILFPVQDKCWCGGQICTSVRVSKCDNLQWK